MLTIEQYIAHCVKQDATLTQTIEGAIKLGFTYDQIIQAIRDWMEENDL